MGQVLKVQLHVLDLEMQHPQEWDSWLCVCELNREGLYAVVQGLVLVIGGGGGPAGWSVLLVHVIVIKTAYASVTGCTHASPCCTGRTHSPPSWHRVTCDQRSGHIDPSRCESKCGFGSEY